MSWIVAPGFTPQIEGLAAQTRAALDRLAARVAAAGATLQVTSAYRPGDALLHGRGLAVDVYAPRLPKTELIRLAQGTGFTGGYVPEGRNFVEFVTGDYWYSVPGQKFTLNQPPDAHIRAWEKQQLPWWQRFDWFGARRTEQAIEEHREQSFPQPEIIPGQWDLSIHSGLRLIVYIFLLIIIIFSIITFVKGG